MTDTLILQPTDFANGGACIARDAADRPIFIPFTIPGETVEARLLDEKAHYAHAELMRIITASPDRVEPRCPHFGVCGGCQFQHMDYAAQLAAKEQIVTDQLQRIGGFTAVPRAPIIPNPQPYGYRAETELTPTPVGGLGYWSPFERQVIPIVTCPILQPDLLALWQDVDLDLPGLRKLTLRIGDDEALLAALEIEDVEPPELETDFPVSVAIVLPDQTAATLVGDNYTIQSVAGQDFRVSPGCYVYPSPALLAPIVETVLHYAALTGTESVIDAYSGVGILTAFLARQAAGVTAVEINPDAVADTAVNLADTDNVSLYEGWVEEVLPQLPTPDLLVVHPPEKGLSKAAMRAVTGKRPLRLIYVSGDIATLARDGKQLAQAGYTLKAVQPLDTAPQTYHLDTISLWQKEN
ncbi:MAG: class I SAM-dependent RNA methyltransferase [Anaerolineales bacterium]|nr:class I SAM-dependent RNA methyltransferase [Anaerolineales bacterium]